MSSKEYVIVTEKLIRNKPHYYIRRHTIKCIGGENMPQEKTEMVFVETAKIPRLARGKTGRNWRELFNKIPVGKAWVVPEEYGSSANIRQQVKNVNKELDKEAFEMTQRTDKETDETTVYVKRLL